jgi:hypothetical protein
METYKNVDEFIKEVFPMEYEKIMKKKKSRTEISIEEFDSVFDEKLNEILKGKSE